MIRRVHTKLSGEATNSRWQLDVALDDYFIKIKFGYLESVNEIEELGRTRAGGAPWGCPG
jgi:hypothetical protein